MGRGEEDYAHVGEGGVSVLAKEGKAGRLCDAAQVWFYGEMSVVMCEFGVVDGMK